MKIRIFRFGSNKILPGIKRWLILLSLGILAIIFGLALLLELRPLSILASSLWNGLRFFASIFPASISGPIILALGGMAVLSSIWYSMKTVLSASDNTNGIVEHKSIIDTLDNAYRKGQGPKIVAIGGGTGLSTLLRGLKAYTNNITAIVAVGDDGGSSGIIREELNIIPPGDIRNCIVALADETEILSNVFQYRFAQGSLKGHSIGNLFLVALFELCNRDIAQATMLASRILRSRGRVLPASLEPLSLSAQYIDGSIVDGESNIPKAGKKIEKIFHKDNIPKPLDEAITAIENADLIVLGPGSLYTSIIPNLLFPDISNAIYKSNAKCLYICNVSNDCETEGYQVSDYIGAIHKHAGNNIINTVLYHQGDEQDNIENLITLDMPKLTSMQIEAISRAKLVDNDNHRHNSSRLARAIMLYLGQ